MKKAMQLLNETLNHQQNEDATAYRQKTIARLVQKKNDYKLIATKETEQQKLQQETFRKKWRLEETEKKILTINNKLDKLIVNAEKNNIRKIESNSKFIIEDIKNLKKFNNIETPVSLNNELINSTIHLDQKSEYALLFLRKSLTFKMLIHNKIENMRKKKEFESTKNSNKNVKLTNNEKVIHNLLDELVECTSIKPSYDVFDIENKNKNFSDLHKCDKEKGNVMLKSNHSGVIESNKKGKRVVGLMSKFFHPNNNHNNNNEKVVSNSGFDDHQNNDEKYVINFFDIYRNETNSSFSNLNLNLNYSNSNNSKTSENKMTTNPLRTSRSNIQNVTTTNAEQQQQQKKGKKGENFCNSLVDGLFVIGPRKSDVASLFKKHVDRNSLSSTDVCNCIINNSDSNKNKKIDNANNNNNNNVDNVFEEDDFKPIEDYVEPTILFMSNSNNDEGIKVLLPSYCYPRFF
jgi:hypothetical protein